jgi:GT2 family glycosyltransferase
MHEHDPMGLTIVIVSHNSRRFLRRCLSSLEKSSEFPKFRVILADNASSDGTVQMVRKAFPWVEVLLFKKNHGFSHACNRAAQSTDSPYVLFLNPDIEVEPDAIARMKEKIEAAEGIGVLGGLVFDPSGRPQHGAKRQIPGIASAFFYIAGFSKLFPERARLNRYAEPHTSAFEEREVGSVSGAFMMVRKKVFDLVGGFDERFFLYAEDMDLCLRMARTGFKVVYFPSARAVHHHRTSTRKTPLVSTYHFYRSMGKFYAKHHPSGAGRLLSPFVHAACGALFAYQATLGQRIRLSGGVVRMERSWLRYLLLLLDLASAVGSWFLAIFVRFGELTALPPFRDYRSYLLFLTILVVVTSGSMVSLKAYRLRPRAAGTALKSTFLVFVILNLIFFYTKPIAFSRLVLIYYSLFLFLALLLSRLLFHVVTVSPLGARLYVKRLALAGTGERIPFLLSKLESIGDRHQVVGVIGRSEPGKGSALPKPYLGSFPEARDIVERFSIDEVIIVENDDGDGEWLHLAGRLSGSHARAWLLTKELAGRLERGEKLTWESLPPLP